MDTFHYAVKLMGYSLKYIKSLQVMGDSKVRDRFDMAEIMQKIKGRVSPYNEASGWTGNSLNILYNAADSSGDGGEYMAATEDDELLALAFFSETSFKPIPYFGADPKLWPVETGENVIYLHWLAGKGRGGGIAIVKELMKIAEAENKMLMLQSTNGARSFYEYAGFNVTPESEMYYYWLPSAIRSEYKDRINSVVNNEGEEG